MVNDFFVSGDYGSMEIPRHWRLKKQRYGLVGEVCPHCDHKIFPPRDVCPNCGGVTNEVFKIVANAQSTEDVSSVLALVGSIPVAE